MGGADKCLLNFRMLSLVCWASSRAGSRMRALGEPGLLGRAVLESGAVCECVCVCVHVHACVCVCVEGQYNCLQTIDLLLSRHSVRDTVRRSTNLKYVSALTVNQALCLSQGSVVITFLWGELKRPVTKVELHLRILHTHTQCENNIFLANMTFNLLTLSTTAA